MTRPTLGSPSERKVRTLTSRTTPRLVLAVLTVLGLVSTACSSPDPQTRLENALARTFDGSFAYELTIAADQAALQGLGQQGAQAGAFLQGFAIAGSRADEAFELRLGFGGFDLVELRSLSEEELYLKLALDQLGAFLGGGQGFDPDATIVPPLEQAGVSGAVIDAVRAAFNGQWVGIEGPIDSDALQDALGGATPSETPTGDDQALREALCEDLEGFAECYLEVQEVTEEDGQDVFQVRLALRELVAALSEAAPTGEQVEDLRSDIADVPEQVPAAVTVQDGVVTRLAVDVAEAVRSGGGDMQGSIELRLDLSDHGEVDEITAPDGATTISGDQLADAMAALANLMGMAGELGAPPTVEPSPAGPSPLEPSPAASG